MASYVFTICEETMCCMGGEIYYNLGVTPKITEEGHGGFSFLKLTFKDDFVSSNRNYE